MRTHPIRHPRDRRARAAWASIVFALLVAACGGGDDAPTGSTGIGGSGSGSGGSGGGGGGSSGGGGSATCGLANFQTELLQRVNAARAAGANCGSEAFAATGALRWDDALTAAAAGHSQDMAAQNYFSHTSQDGRSFSARIGTAGYRWSRVAENIAAGYPTVQAVMDGWLASPGHCANLLNPNLVHIGVACAPGTATSTYRSYWTMDLGTPQ